MRRLLVTVSLAVVVSLNVLGTGALAAPRVDSQYVSGEQIVQTALRYLGYPYTTTGNSPSTGFSCIGFVSYVYQVNGIPLPDNLWSAMAYAPAVSYDDLQPGDVLFFQNTVWPGLSHTAIYIGAGRFVQAEWYNRGVVISSFTNDPIDGNYWQEKYLGANRPWGSVSVPQPGPTPSPTPVVHRPAPALRPGPRLMVGVAGLNVRARPSLRGVIRAVADHGARVVLLKRYRSWDWVQMKNGRFGWVYDQGLAGQGATAAAPARRLRNLPVTRVTVGGLRVHSRPNLAAPVVAGAYRGERVHLLRSYQDWTRVLLANGSRGWVVDNYLAGIVTSGSVPAARSRVRGLTARLTAGVRVHARPGLRAPVVGLAARGSRVRVLGQSGNWVRVLFHGQSAYIDALYVQR